MGMLRTLTIAAAFALSACSPTVVKPTQPAPPPSPTVPVEAMPTDQDLFALMIDVGRIGMFLDRTAMAAGVEIPYVQIPEQPGLDPQSEQSIWRNLRQYGRDVVFFKEVYCARGFVKGAPCAAKPPAFIAAEDSPPPDKVALQKHLEELQIFFDPILQAACERGKRESKDEMFCSVE
jgi:hypothetical protein